jgi:hypothetical protein
VDGSYKNDIFYHLYKHSRGMQYDMTVPASGQGVLTEPSLSRIGFVVSNPFGAVIQLSLQVIDTNDLGIILPPVSGPHFFSLEDFYGGIRQRWHFRCTGVAAGSMFSIIEFLADMPI